MNFADYVTAQSVQAAARAAGSAVDGDWAGAVQALGRGTVTSVTIRTQFSPPFTFDPFAETPPDAPPNPILALVKPEITIDTAGGALVMAPYGEPTANYLPRLVAGVAIGVLGFVALVATIARRF